MNWNDPVEVAGHAAAVAASESKSVSAASAQRDHHLIDAVFALYNNLGLLRSSIHPLAFLEFERNMMTAHLSLAKLGVTPQRSNVGSEGTYAVGKSLTGQLSAAMSNLSIEHKPFVYADMTPVEDRLMHDICAEHCPECSRIAGQNVTHGWGS